MKLLLTIGAFLALIAFSASAATLPACPVALYSVYDTTYGPGSSGCMIGDKVFTGFVHEHDPNSVEHPDTSIMVTPDDSNPNAPGLIFGFTGPFQTVTAGLASNFDLLFQVTSTGAPIVGNVAMLQGSQIGSGNIDLLKQFCLNGSFTPGQPPTTGCTGLFDANDSIHINDPLTGGVNQTRAQALLEGSTTEEGVRDNFQITGGNPPNSSATLMEAANYFPEAVPEPGTTALFSIGLIGLGLVGRKLRRG